MVDINSENVIVTLILGIVWSQNKNKTNRRYDIGLYRVVEFPEAA